MKILIIQTAFIGDVILTTPLISSVKKIYPDSAIDFLTIPKSVNILENNPDLNQIIIFDKNDKDSGLSGLMRLGTYLKSQSYDICFTPHRSLRSAFLSYTTGAQKRIGFDRSAFKWAYTNIVIYRYDIHEIERNLSLLGQEEYGLNISKPLIYPSDEDINIVNQILKDNFISKKSRIFAFAPGSIWPTKRWPENYFADLCRMLVSDGYVPLLIGGPDDIGICEEIQRACPQSRSLAGILSLRQSTYLLKKCTGLITNDSAPLHLGLAADIPVYAIFGATVPEFGFAPFGEKDKVIEYKDLACRPCGKHGSAKCPVKSFDCMLKLTPEKVYSELNLNLTTE